MNEGDFGRQFELPKVPDEVELNESEQKKSAAWEKLSSLPGAKIRELAADSQQGYEVFAVDVLDKKQWCNREGVKKLIDVFGKLAFDAFEPKDNPKTYNPEDKKSRSEAKDSITSNVITADKVYVVGEHGEIKGFLAVEAFPLENGTKAMYVHLISVDRQRSNQGYAEKLYSQAFNEADVSAFIGLTFRPEAVKKRMAVAKDNGYTSFYGNNKEGEWGNQGTPEEQARLKELNDILILKSKEWEVLVDKEVPDGYVVWEGESTLPPLKEEQVNFPEGDPLGQTFREGVLKIQEQVAPDTVFASLINLKNQTNEKT